VLTLIEDLPPGVVGVEAHGNVTAGDYERVLVPAVEAALRQRRQPAAAALPGEVMMFPSGELDAARAWLTAGA
jgi:hypothetical protein